MNAAAKPVVDWPAIIDELRNAKFSMTSIADEAGVSLTTIKEWRQGIKTPMYSTGERLVEFWCRYTSKSVSDLPRVEW